MGIANEMVSHDSNSKVRQLMGDASASVTGGGLFSQRRQNSSAMNSIESVRARRTTSHLSKQQWAVLVVLKWQPQAERRARDSVHVFALAACRSNADQPEHLLILEVVEGRSIDAVSLKGERLVSICQLQPYDCACAVMRAASACTYF
eukprot:6220-Heterococcus_DN1.PRE.2